MTIDSRIFRAYDIRGKAHEQLSEEACLLIGKAFGSILRERTESDHPAVAVGRDARTHGPVLEQALIDGLVSTGCRVIKIGQTPSPVNYFTICHQKLDGGVQVTASHNPKDDNGLKLQTAEAQAHAGDNIQKLRERIEDARLPDGQGKFLAGEGSIENINATIAYKDHLVSLFKDCGKGLSVAVDSGNGVAGPLYCEILRAVGCDVTELYTEPDGNFPNHAADPSKHETLRELQKTVTEKNADLGVAFDGDGDRLGLVDEKGHIRSADEILLLLAKDHLSRNPKAPIVFTVSNSGIVESEVASLGGQPVMCKVGHSFVEHAMRKHGSLLGGEQSGHFFCGEDYFPYDDALVACLRLLKILSSKKESVSSLCETFPKVYQEPEMRPACPDEDKARIVAAATEHFAASYPVNTLDGARIDFGDHAWAGIRYSNTSPCLSICMEARRPEKLEEVKNIVLTHLKNYREIGF